MPPQRGDGVYVSSALGRTKRSGALYREMLKAEKITANAVHHYGDNPHSDVDVLKAEGFFDDLPIGIADLGWYLTVQTALQRLSARLAPTSSRAPHDADNSNKAGRGARNPAPLR